MGPRTANGAEGTTSGPLPVVIWSDRNGDDRADIIEIFRSTTKESVMIMLIIAMAGLFSFRVKARWCPRCGGMTVPSTGKPEGRL